MKIVTKEENAPKARCVECKESFPNLYHGTMLCKRCYKLQDRVKPVVLVRCVGCKKLIKSGYKGTWLCKYCYRNKRV